MYYHPDHSNEWQTFRDIQVEKMASITFGLTLARKGFECYT
jgi:hypothetical protein